MQLRSGIAWQQIANGAANVLKSSARYQLSKLVLWHFLKSCESSCADENKTNAAKRRRIETQQTTAFLRCFRAALRVNKPSDFSYRYDIVFVYISCVTCEYREFPINSWP